MKIARDKILVVDDDQGIRDQLMWALNDSYEVLSAGDGARAMEIIREQEPQVVALDISLSPIGQDEEGFEVLRKTMELDSKSKVIMITGNETKHLALKAIQMGAYDYFTKPIDLPEIKVIINRAIYIRKLERENELLTEKLQEERKFHGIIGNCPQMLNVFDIVDRVATTNATVLIYGESGTGKEVMARAIHRQSLRKNKPFTPINCGAIPENLLESELFGYEKGAFTGAVGRRKGKFELADGGTLFLDEIAELTLALQVKILRFLQEREIERVGGREPIELDVRIIAATNKNLQEEMEKNTFREDLYYRLSVVSISLPPLRDRGEDIVLLANSFLSHFNKEYGKNLKRYSTEALLQLQTYKWPGNVRELENRVKRAVIMARGNLVVPEDLDLQLLEKGGRLTLRQAKKKLERNFIREALIRNRGNISRAARELAISRATLYDLLEKHQIDKEDMK
ncbi:MAG: Fis family transcriptional regulator [candidate division Zixibacteria bacterium SM23_81]|nr:MAG: Fis family transcriptional regulator [candidate division Zixibacteria bacterium SM23_81]